MRRLVTASLLVPFFVACAATPATPDAEVEAAESEQTQTADASEAEQYEGFPPPPELPEHSLRLLTNSNLNEHLEAEESFVVYLAIAHCPTTPEFLTRVNDFALGHDLTEHIYLLAAADMEDMELVMKVLPRLRAIDGTRQAAQQLIAFENGRFVDWNEARDQGGEEQFLSFFARNGYLESEEPVFVFDFTDQEAEKALPYILSGGGSAMQLQGLNFDGQDLNNLSFGGSDLRAASFVGANLEGSSFAYADLRGADLTEANLENVHWHRTICPDGTNSDDQGGSCGD